MKFNGMMDNIGRQRVPLRDGTSLPVRSIRRISDSCTIGTASHCRHAVWQLDENMVSDCAFFGLKAGPRRAPHPMLPIENR
jgi:hypothetical protein